MPFKNPPIDLRLPDDETSVAFIFLDGETGEITIVGTSGSKIVISPNELNPSIRFYSPDGSNDAFINAVNFGIPTVSDLGVNSGKWTPPDGVQRRGRLYLNTNVGGSLGAMQLGVIKALTQVLFGGFVQAQSNGLFLGYRDDDASILGEISALRSGSTVDMQVKSGPYTPADAVQRIGRILMQPGSDFFAFSVIKTSNNAVKGGLAQIAYDRGLFGYRDADGAIYNRMAVVSNALQLISENGQIQFFTDTPTDSTRLLRDNVSMLPNVEFVQNTPVVSTTSSGVYANAPITALTYNKIFSDTPLIAEVSGSAFCTGAVGTVVDLAVRVGTGGDIFATHFFFNTLSEHHAIPLGIVKLTGLAAGTHSIQLRWRRPAGTGTINVDTNDILCLKVSEVRPF